MKEVYVTTKTGKLFKGYLSDSKNSERIIIHIHGMQSTPTKDIFIATMQEGYPIKEISFLTVEHSGTGVITEVIKGDKKIQLGGAMELFEDCVEDIQAWVDYARSIGYSQIWLQAHSLGTPKAVYYLNRSPSEIAGLILLSPSEIVGLVHDDIGQKDFDRMYPEAKILVENGKFTQILSHKLWEENPISARTFLNLFDKGTNAAIFNYADDTLGWKEVNKIMIPVLAITGTLDDGIATVINPKIAMQKLEHELINAPRKSTRVYEGAEHNFNGFESNIVRDVIDFINE